MTDGGRYDTDSPGEEPVGPLPEAVRQRVISLAADAVGGLGPQEVPRSLRQVARFAPAKRARLGANAIAACLETDAAFRIRVVEHAGVAADLLEAVKQGTAPAAADPVEVAALAYLLRPVGWTEQLETAEEAVRKEATAAESARESVVVTRLQEQLSTARTAAREERERLKAEIERLKQENTTLRRRLFEARDRARAAESAADDATTQAKQAVSAAETARATAEAEARRLRTRLTEAEQGLEKARKDVRESRGLADAKLRLLLDTLTDAARSLGRELALPPSDLRPADTVAAATPGAGPPTGALSSPTEDPAQLEALLGLPRVHLVIDGYNVTKQEWGDMALEAQRKRLAKELGALASRTHAEITCVFDGAKLESPPPISAPRGVRIKFSLPGITADDLICNLVRAEPEGRPVVVVSSDREVVRGVRRSGVYPVSSKALLRLITR